MAAAEGPTAVPHLPSPGMTLVEEAGRLLLSIEGALVLPVGARVDVDGATTSVVGIHLRQTAEGTFDLVLEVEAQLESVGAAISEAEAEREVVAAAEGTVRDAG